MSTPWMFLLGSRRAMLDAAAGWRVALLVGALLVLSAGLARNYDGEDLRSEPWWLLGPFVASVLTSLALFGLYKFLAWTKGTSLPARLYVPFLGLYWLTAPLAWLYGVPYEKFLSPVGAVWANAATLAVVAAWRVLLMARVAQVLLGCSLQSAVLVDLWFGVAVVWLASLLGPKPVLDVMGGLRVSEVERIRNDLVIATLFWGFVLMVLLLIPAIAAAGRMRLPLLAELTRFGVFLRRDPRGERRGWTAVWIAALTVVAWVPGLVVEQPRQREAFLVAAAIEAGRFDAAADLLAGATRERLPAGWQVPVGGGYLERRERLNGMVDAVERSPRPVPAWIRRQLVEAAGDALSVWGYWPRGQSWVDMLGSLDAEIAQGMDDEPRARNLRMLNWMAAQTELLTSEERRAVVRGLQMFGERPHGEPQR